MSSSGVWVAFGGLTGGVLEDAVTLLQVAGTVLETAALWVLASGTWLSLGTSTCT